MAVTIELLLYCITGILIVAAGLILLFFFVVAIYRLAFHPLARIPGPSLAAVSNIWLAFHVRKGRSRVLGKTLHHTYGPAVRVGPNEVWFNSEEAFKHIYGALLTLPYSLKSQTWL